MINNNNNDKGVNSPRDIIILNTHIPNNKSIKLYEVTTDKTLRRNR